MTESSLSELYEVLTSHPTLNSISIVPTEGQSLIVECENLAIPTKAFKELGLYAYKQFQLTSESDKASRGAELDKLTTVLVLLSPDDSRFWNHRKRAMKSVSVSVSVLTSELQLASNSLKLKPKSHEAFNHCRWLLNKFSHLVTDQIVTNQLNLCELTAKSYKHNYFSWTYRHWVISNFSSNFSLKGELAWSRGWIETHISEFCGMNYRFSLLRLTWQGRGETGNSFGKINTILDDEVLFLCDLVKYYPSQKALWYYLRMLLLFCDAHELYYRRKCEAVLVSCLKVDNNNRFLKSCQITNDLV